MQALRNASVLARIVLAWFALAIGAAVASPLVKPVGMDLVGTGGGALKIVVKAEGGDTGKTTSATLDCPLCLSISAPPPAIAKLHEPRPELREVLRPIP